MSQLLYINASYPLVFERFNVLPIFYQHSYDTTRVQHIALSFLVSRAVALSFLAPSFLALRCLTARPFSRCAVVSRSIALSSLAARRFSLCRLTLAFSPHSRILVLLSLSSCRSLSRTNFCRMVVLSHGHCVASSSCPSQRSLSRTLRRPLVLAHIDIATIRILRIPHDSENITRPSNSENPTSAHARPY
jgi:hypothetical protein